MFKKKKILCYVMVYDQVAIIKKTLNFLVKDAGRLEIVIIENPSEHSPEIHKFVDGLGKKGLIARYYAFDENITNNALNHVLRLEMPQIKKRPFVMMSDGDLTSSDKGWLDEELHILKAHREVLLCSISLEMSNLPLKTYPSAKDWIPPDLNEYDDYYEAYTGTHLQLIRGKDLASFFDWTDSTDTHVVDTAMHKYCYEIAKKKMARTKKSKAYHLTWDLYADLNHPYTKSKNAKSLDDIWHHKKLSTFTLKEY